MSKYNCSCFCGSVRFEASLTSYNMSVCHCSMCRKLTGSTGFASLEFKDDITYISRENLGTYDSSSNATRGFCKKCGTSLFDHYKPMNAYFVPPAIIENLSDEKIKFVEEIYYDNKPCYYTFANDTKKSYEPIES